MGVMKNGLLFAIAVSFLYCSMPAYAAVIHGTVYDLALDPIDAFVEINTVPRQFYVASGGDYEFTVPPGKYLLIANTTDGSAYEPIEIVDDGNYTIDIVVGLNIDDPIDFTTDEPAVTEVASGIDGSTSSNTLSAAFIGILIVIVLTTVIIALFVYSNSRKQKKTRASAGGEDISDLEMKTIALVRKHSPVTQKELRKMLPYSEGKISLVVSQLESEGKIKKIKKGRGNILVYVKG